MNLSIGDLVVRFGKVLKVNSVEADLITLKPYFKSAQSQGLLYSILKKNLDTGQIRNLTSKAELVTLWKKVLLPETAATADMDSNPATLIDTIKLLKSLWQEKQKNKGVLPGARLSLYQQTLNQASDEVAAVKHLLPEVAKSMILKTFVKIKPVDNVPL